MIVGLLLVIVLPIGLRIAYPYLNAFLDIWAGQERPGSELPERARSPTPGLIPSQGTIHSDVIEA